MIARGADLALAFKRTAVPVEQPVSRVLVYGQLIPAQNPKASFQTVHLRMVNYVYPCDPAIRVRASLTVCSWCKRLTSVRQFLM